MAYGARMVNRRDAAHILLDAITGFDPAKGDHPDNEVAITTALERLELSDEARREARPLLLGTADLLTALIYVIADMRTADPTAVIAVTRDHMDVNIYGHKPR